MVLEPFDTTTFTPKEVLFAYPPAGVRQPVEMLHGVALYVNTVSSFPSLNIMTLGAS